MSYQSLSIPGSWSLSGSGGTTSFDGATARLDNNNSGFQKVLEMTQASTPAMVPTGALIGFKITASNTDEEHPTEIFQFSGQVEVRASGVLYSTGFWVFPDNTSGVTSTLELPAEAFDAGTPDAGPDEVIVSVRSTPDEGYGSDTMYIIVSGVQFDGSASDFWTSFVGTREVG